MDCGFEFDAKLISSFIFVMLRCSATGNFGSLGDDDNHRLQHRSGEVNVIERKCTSSD